MTNRPSRRSYSKETGIEDRRRMADSATYSGSSLLNCVSCNRA